MTHSNANLRDQARQGKPQAIATLLNRSLQSRNIRAQVRRQEARLLIQLTSRAPLDQQAIATQIMRGLQRLEVQGIEAVQLQARQPDATDLTWRVHIPWPDAIRSPDNAPVPSAAAAAVEDDLPSTETQSSVNSSPNESPTDASPPSPPAGIAIATLSPFSSPVVLPGWSFWFGWVLVTYVCTVLAYFARYQSSSPGLDYGRYFASLLAARIIGAIGEWLMLRQEVAWAKTWLEATMIGSIASGLLQLLVTAITRATPGRTPLLLSMLLGLIVVAPIAMMQWAVLRRYIDQAYLWLGAIAGITILPQLLGLIRPLYLIGYKALPLLTYMITGAMMVYLLRRSHPEALYYNRCTDVESRQRLLRQRRKVNGLFFLEWIGWTLLGWAVGSVLQGVSAFLAAFVPFLSFLTIPIMIGSVTSFQAIALRRRIDGFKDWWQWSLMAIIVLPLMMGIIVWVLVLFFGQRLWLWFNQLDVPGVGMMPFFAMMGLGILGGLISITAVTIAQSTILKRYGYRSSWWLYGHLAMLICMAGQIPRGMSEFFSIISILIFIPAATMVWMLGYPKSLQSRFPV
ncbi:MAG: hypothetical protein AB4042_04230 [Leptolyngbyaceae cyanobacterium]